MSTRICRSLPTQNIQLPTQPSAHACMSGLALKSMIKYWPDFWPVPSDVIFQPSYHDFYLNLKPKPAVYSLLFLLKLYDFWRVFVRQKQLART
jgi:hypothetical protein